MKKNWIDIDKLANTLDIKYERSSLYVEEESKEYSYCFNLFNLERVKRTIFDPVKLYISPQIQNTVFLQIRIYDKFLSTIDFGKITKVTFVPEHKKIIFESLEKNTVSVLEVYGCGMFELHYGLDKFIYKDTKWSKK